MAKVLIIEDEKAMSDLITIKFKVDGFEVDQAFSLAEAKAKLTSQKYDAVLSDYLLPDGNSLDLFTELKPQLGTLPIVLATNYIEDLSQDKAKSLGINEVIVKYQVVPAQMVEKIKTLIGNSGVLNPTPIAGAPNPLPPTPGNLPSAQEPLTVTPGTVVPAAAAPTVADTTPSSSPVTAPTGIVVPAAVPQLATEQPVTAPTQDTPAVAVPPVSEPVPAPIATTPVPDPAVGDTPTPVTPSQPESHPNPWEATPTSDDQPKA
jgi:CheY-like chemotaxis protein